MADAGFWVSYGAAIWPLILAVGAVLGAAVGWTIGPARARAGARGARARLGRNAGSPSPRLVGQAIALSGTLEVRGPACARFDDGEEAAAATATRWQEGARPCPGGARRGRGAGAPVVFAEVSVRAATLVLRAAGTAVFLEGPVRVLAGSREASFGGRFQPFGQALLDRVGASDLAVEWELRRRSGAAQFRSLGSGDRVRVAGILERREAADEGAQSYRESAARWCLTPDPSGLPGAGPVSLRVAFEGAPRVTTTAWPQVAGALAGALLSLGAMGGGGLLAMNCAHDRLTVAGSWATPTAADLGESEASLAAAMPFARVDALAHLEAIASELRKRGEPPYDDRSRTPPPVSREDRLERCLDAADFMGASEVISGSGTSYDGAWEERYRAAVHLLAGDLSGAAAAVRRHGDRWPSSYPMPLCIADAVAARSPGNGASAALDRLRAASREPTSGAAICRLLLIERGSRTVRSEALDVAVSAEDVEGPLHLWRRLHSLLELEAGRSPTDPPARGLELPRAMGLIYRSPWGLAERTLGVQVARALPGTHHTGDAARWEAHEAANAAYALSALGDPDGARRAWTLAKERGIAFDPIELLALRVAIEIRAGDRTAARKLAMGLPVDHAMAQLVDLLDGREIAWANVSEYSNVRALSRLLERGDDATEIARELTRPGSFADGEMLFLVAPQVKAGRDLLLQWVRFGNPEHDRHDGKGPPPPPAPVDRLMRLEDRRMMAEGLGDHELAEALASPLRSARERLLERDLALLLALLGA
jgi:hypothetical protein